LYVRATNVERKTKKSTMTQNKTARTNLRWQRLQFVWRLRCAGWRPQTAGLCKVNFNRLLVRFF